MLSRQDYKSTDQQIKTQNTPLSEQLANHCSS